MSKTITGESVCHLGLVRRFSVEVSMGRELKKRIGNATGEVASEATISSGVWACELL